MWLIEGLMNRLLPLHGIQCSFFPAIGGGYSTGVDIGDNVPYSLLLDSAQTQYLTYTPAVGATTSRKKNEFHIKFKRCKDGTRQSLLCIGTASNDTQTLQIYIGTDNKLHIAGGSTNFRISTKQYKVFDGHYFLTVSIDTPQAAAADRLKVYDETVGLMTSWDTNNSVTQNSDMAIFSNQVHYIGSDPNDTSRLFDGYAAHAYLVEDQNYGESGYTRISQDTLQRVNKTFSGVYGARGCFLKFDNPSALGNDSSGNNNHWTLNGGINSTNQVSDTPTKNFAVLSPSITTGGVVPTLSKGNTKYTSTTVGGISYSSIQIPTTGKWWVELKHLTPSWALGFGIGDQSNSGNGYLDASSNTCWYYSYLGSKYVNSTTGTAYGAAWGYTDTIGMLCDADAGTVTFYKQTGSSGNFVSQGAITYPVGGKHVVVGAENGSVTVEAQLNFGARPFNYELQHGALPSGAKALNTANLPDVAIKNSRKHFDVRTRLGNAVQDRLISAPYFDDIGLAWIKARGVSSAHVLVNKVSGGGKQLFSNLTNSAQTNSDISNGFTASGLLLGDNLTGTGSTNQLDLAYADFLWAMGGTPVTNTQGSIQSQVCVNSIAGQGVARWKGNNVHGATVGHAMGTSRLMVLAKNEGAATDWAVSHPSLSSQAHKLYLDQNYNEQLLSSTSYGGIGAISSTLLTLHNGSVSGLDANGNLNDIVALLFSEVEGHSKLGHWDGTGVNPGPWVYCGFKPRFILGKCSTLNGSWWFIFDTVRNTVNPLSSILAPHLPNSETTSIAFEVSAFGFRVVSTSSDYNASGHRYIFYAVAECAGKYATAF